MDRSISAVSRPERILYKKTIAEFSSGRVHYADGEVNWKICRAERTDSIIIFIPRRRYIYICPRVQLILLVFTWDIIHYGLRNFAFKNTLDDGPLLNPENFYNWWGWKSGIIFLLFFLDTQIKYSLGIGVYVHIYTFVQNNYLMGFIFWTGWGVPPTLRNNIFWNHIL